MSIHKLTAGDGYSYLTRQVAALDVTDRGYCGLADYYSQQGESPGLWFGSALGDVDLRGGDEVTEEQMASLFGEGKHPNADAIMDAARAEAPMLDALSFGRCPDRADRPATMGDAQAAIRLGQPFAVIDTAPEFQVALAQACAQANLAVGLPKDTPLAAAQRARIRTDVGRQMFAREYGRPARNPRELSSFIARHSRAATTAVAGFDLTFTPVKSVSALWAIAPPGGRQPDRGRPPCCGAGHPFLAREGGHPHPRRPQRSAAVGSSWPSRPPWRPETPSTAPAPKPSSGPSGGPRQHRCWGLRSASTGWPGP